MAKKRVHEIAKAQGLKLIPIGATGYMAQELWTEMNGNLEAYYPAASADLKAAFAELNDPKADHVAVVVKILDILKKG